MWSHEGELCICFIHDDRHFHGKTMKSLIREQEHESPDRFQQRAETVPLNCTALSYVSSPLVSAVLRR